MSLHASNVQPGSIMRSGPVTVLKVPRTDQTHSFKPINTSDERDSSELSDGSKNNVKFGVGVLSNYQSTEGSGINHLTILKLEKYLEFVLKNPDYASQFPFSAENDFVEFYVGQSIPPGNSIVLEFIPTEPSQKLGFLYQREVDGEVFALHYPTATSSYLDGKVLVIKNEAEGPMTFSKLKLDIKD